MYGAIARETTVSAFWSTRQGTFRHILQLLMINKSKRWLKIILDTRHRTSQRYPTYITSALYVFENTCVRKLLRCVGVTRFNEKKIMYWISICGSLLKRNKSHPFLKERLRAIKNGWTSFRLSALTKNGNILKNKYLLYLPIVVRLYAYWRI